MVAFIRTGRVAGGWLLLSLAACGGRTSELDGYETDTGSSLPSDAGTSAGGKGATSGSTSSGASTSTGATTSSGGSAPTGGSTGVAGAPTKGGAPGTGGISGTAGGFGQAGAATGGSVGLGGMGQVACTELCLDPTSACPGQFGPPAQCANECFAALTINNGACEGVGSALALCFKNVAEKYGSDCSVGASQAPISCLSLLNSYQACASGTIPTPPPTSCSGGGSAAPGKCSLNQMCSDGTYSNVTCYEQSPSETACTCQTGTVTANITLNEPASYACNDALVACTGSTLPK